MSTRWSAGRGYNALSRGVVTSPHEDLLHVVGNLFAGLPLKAARFTQTGQNDVLVDMDLIQGQDPATVVVRVGETLTLLAGTAVTIFNERTQSYLQDDGVTWNATPNTVDAPLSIVVQNYAVMQRDWAYLTISGDPGAVLAPMLNSMTVHGHEGLYQLADAIQWHSGAAANPTGLVVQALPLSFSQLLSAPAPVTDQFHRLSFFGALPYVGEVVLCALRTITRCTGSGRLLPHTLPKADLSIPAGTVGSYAWAVREVRRWSGRIRGNPADVSALHEELTRASKSGADPMLLIPEDGVVMLGRVGDVFDPRTKGPVSFDMEMSFDEAPLLLAEEA